MAFIHIPAKRVHVENKRVIFRSFPEIKCIQCKNYVKNVKYIETMGNVLI